MLIIAATWEYGLLIIETIKFLKFTDIILENTVLLKKVYVCLKESQGGKTNYIWLSLS